MKHWDKEKLISLLKASEEGRIELEDAMREIATFENIKSNSVVTSACHELRHFYIDADLRAIDHVYDALMKKRLSDFIERIQQA